MAGPPSAEDLRGPGTAIIFAQPHVSRAFRQPARSHRTDVHWSEEFPCRSPVHHRCHVFVGSGSSNFDRFTTSCCGSRNGYVAGRPGGGLSAAPGGDPPVVTKAVQVTNSDAPAQVQACIRTGTGAGSQRIVAVSIAHPFSTALPIREAPSESDGHHTSRSPKPDTGR